MASDAARFAPTEERDYLANILKSMGCRFAGGVVISDESRNQRSLTVFNYGDQCRVLLKRSFRFAPWYMHHALPPFGRMTAAEFNDLLGT